MYGQGYLYNLSHLVDLSWAHKSDYLGLPVRLLQLLIIMFPLHIQVSLKAGTVLFVPCSDRDPGLTDLAQVIFLCCIFCCLDSVGLSFPGV